MLVSYIRTEIVNAEPEFQDGRAGYAIYFPTGHSDWMAEGEFERTFRAITLHERQVIQMTEDEAAIARISDGSDPNECPNHPGGHEYGEYQVEPDCWTCDHCGHESAIDPHI